MRSQRTLGHAAVLAAAAAAVVVLVMGASAQGGVVDTFIDQSVVNWYPSPAASSKTVSYSAGPNTGVSFDVTLATDNGNLRARGASGVGGTGFLADDGAGDDNWFCGTLTITVDNFSGATLGDITFQLLDITLQRLVTNDINFTSTATPTMQTISLGTPGAWGAIPKIALDSTAASMAGGSYVGTLDWVVIDGESWGLYKLLSFEVGVQSNAAYWDLNNTGVGAGGSAPAGVWNATDPNWNTDATGGAGGTVGAWTPGYRAVFAAGNDANGAYTVNVDGTHDIVGLAFEEGTVTLATATGGQLRLVNNADVDVASGLTATIQTSITEDATPRSLAKKGAGTLVLSGAGSYTGKTTVQDGTLRLGADNVLPDASAVTVSGNAAGVTATLDLAGYSDTIGSLTLGGSTATSGAAVTTGVGTLTLGGDVTYNSANNPLGATISGKVDLGAATRTFTVNDSATVANDLTVSAAISGTGAGLIKAGAGTLVLSGANTYTGGTNISVGALVLSSAGTLGDSANALTMSGGRLDLGTLSQTVGAVSITAAAGSADTIGNGSLTGTSYSASNASGNVIVSANLLGDATLTMSGAGTLTLSGTNTYTGTTTVSAGVLQAATRAALPGYDSADRVVINGGTLLVVLGGGWTIGDVETVVANATKTSGTLALDTSSGDATQTTAWDLGGLGLTKLGGNALTLNRANTITGTTTIRGGTLKLQNAGAGLTQTLGSLTLAGPDVTLQSDNAGTGTLSTTFGALTARVAGNTANIVSTGGTNGTDNIINLTGAAGFIDKGVFFGGANYAALDAVNTYVRALAYGSDPDAEVVDTITTNKHVKLASSPAARVGDTLLSLNLAGSGVNYTMSSGTLTAPGILKSGGGAVCTISGGTAVTGGTGVELVIRTDASSDLLAVSTPVKGTGALTKSGAGTLTLSGANTYTGATTINNGTLVYQNTYASPTHAIASLATLEINVASGTRGSASTTFSGAGTLVKSGGGELVWASTAATFAMESGSLIDVQGGTFTGGSYGNENWTANLSSLNVASGAVFDGDEANVRVDALAGAGTIKSGYVDGSGSVTFGVNNGSGTFSGVLANAEAAGSGFVKTGTGTQILSGAANAYTGATLVSAGTLALSGAGAINTTSGITVNGPTAAFMQNSSATNTRTFTLTRGTLGGTGTISTAITIGPNVTIAPGDRTLVAPEAGTLTIANAVDLTGGATEMRLFSTAANDSDVLMQSTTGGLTYGGILKVVAVGSLAFAAGNNWDLFEFDSRNGTSVFSNDSEFGTVGGTYLPLLAPDKKWSFNYGTGVLSVAWGIMPGDTNGDWVVDAADFINLKKNFGAGVGGGVGVGNFDNTGTVNWADLSTLMTNMGTGGPAPATTPEPATLGLLAIGALAVLRRRRAA